MQCVSSVTHGSSRTSQSAHTHASMCTHATIDCTHTIQCPDTGDEYALKRMKKAGLDDSDVKSIHKEVSMLKRCQHEHVLQFHSFLEDDSYFYIVTSLVSGGDLHSCVEKRGVGSLSTLELQKFAFNLLSMIEFLQSKSVVSVVPRGVE